MSLSDLVRYCLAWVVGFVFDKSVPVGRGQPNPGRHPNRAIAPNAKPLKHPAPDARGMARGSLGRNIRHTTPEAVDDKRARGEPQGAPWGRPHTHAHNDVLITLSGKDWDERQRTEFLWATSQPKRRVAQCTAIDGKPVQQIHTQIHTGGSSEHDRKNHNKLVSVKPGSTEGSRRQFDGNLRNGPQCKKKKLNKPWTVPEDRTGQTWS
jgi:hypothetical protein